jgi:hypothetical protein
MKELLRRPAWHFKGEVMAEFHLVLNEQEKAYLEGLLKSALGETRVEVHRTHTPDYRQQVLGEEELVRQLLAKVQKP